MDFSIQVTESMNRTLGMVAALHSEAVLLAGRRHWVRIDGQLVKRIRLPDRTRLVVARSGMGPARAGGAANRLIRQGAGALMSAGVCAGTHPDMVPGDLVVADRVIRMDENGLAAGSWQADGNITGYACRELQCEGFSVRSGCLVSAPHPVGVSAEKIDIAGRFGAVALDMESAAVAEAAAAKGLPFFVLRAVSDPVMQPVPPDVFECLDVYGGLRYAAFCRRVFARPVLVFEIRPLALQFRKACRSLKAGWSVLKASALPAMLSK